MASARTTPEGDRRDERIRDEFIREAEESESGAVRNLFDLRMIIGGLFVVYGVYLTIRGLFDSAAAVSQAAGVRINLWTGLFALGMGLAFVAWALLRPLRMEEIAEAGVADDDDDEAGEAEGAPRRARRPQH
jgi:hypothetical protein